MQWIELGEEDRSYGGYGHAAVQRGDANQFAEFMGRDKRGQEAAGVCIGVGADEAGGGEEVGVCGRWGGELDRRGEEVEWWRYEEEEEFRGSSSVHLTAS